MSEEKPRAIRYNDGDPIPPGEWTQITQTGDDGPPATFLYNGSAVESMRRVGGGDLTLGLRVGIWARDLYDANGYVDPLVLGKKISTIQRMPLPEAMAVVERALQEMAKIPR